MPALVAGIHVFAADPKRKAWMAGTSPAMTRQSVSDKGRTNESKGAAAIPRRSRREPAAAGAAASRLRQFASREIDAGTFGAIQDEAIRDVVRLQAAAGLEVVTD